MFSICMFPHRTKIQLFLEMHVVLHLECNEFSKLLQIYQLGRTEEGVSISLDITSLF